jgi:hypothetical protein
VYRTVLYISTERRERFINNEYYWLLECKGLWSSIKMAAQVSSKRW